MVSQSVQARARSSEVGRAWRNELIRTACGYILFLCIEAGSDTLDTLVQKILPDGSCYLVDRKSVPLCNVLGNIEHEVWKGNDIYDRERKGAEHGVGVFHSVYL